MDKARDDLTDDEVVLLDKNLDLINKMADEIDKDILDNSEDLPDLVLEKSRKIREAADEIVKILK